MFSCWLTARATSAAAAMNFFQKLNDILDAADGEEDEGSADADTGSAEAGGGAGAADTEHPPRVLPSRNSPRLHV